MHPAPRLSYIDNLRVVAFSMMVLYHAFKLFSPEGWGIHHTPLPWAKLWAEIISSWRLPLLFFISGSALNLSIRKQNIAKRFAKKLLPLLIVGTPILVAAANYLADLHTHANATYWHHLSQYFVDLSHGKLSWYHLWYLGYILFFAVVHQWVHDHIPMPNWRVNPWVLVGGLIALSFVNEWLLRPYFPVRRDFIHDWASIVTFACFYGVGIVVIRHPSMLDLLQKARFVMTTIAVLALYVHFDPIGLPFFFTKTAAAWTVVLALNGLFQRYLNIKNNFTARLHGRMLDIYAIHQVTLLFAAVLLASVSDNIMKVWIIFVTGFGLAYLAGGIKSQVKQVIKSTASILSNR